jgi:glutathione synthase/RimK-type ligase-like ATP-grasp enzyme
MIAFWGVMEDPPLAAVAEGLQALNIKTFHLDQRRMDDYCYEFTLQDGELYGSISLGDVSLDLEEVSGIYLRPCDLRQLEEFEDIPEYSEKWMAAVRFEDALTFWCEMAQCVVVNRPEAMDSNISKPYQLDIIRSCGFAVPDTLITTDPEAVWEFWKKHQDVVYKSISNRRSIVTRLNANDQARLNEVAFCPTQFQQYIKGTDYRVHVLGDEVFASRIVSTGDDYRYSNHTQSTAATIPEDIAVKCISLSHKLGVFFSGIDLRQTSHGQWFCFEANTCPGYTSFGDQAAAITRSLVTFFAGQTSAG